MEDVVASGGLRGWRSAPGRLTAGILGACLLLGLTGCVGGTAPMLTSPPSTVPTEANSDAQDASCLGDISYPNINAQPLGLGLPLEGLLSDYQQTELLIARGTGECNAAPASLGQLPDACSPVTGSGESVLDVMLWSLSDDLSEAMFAAGADRALSETIIGYVDSTANPFTVRTTAWRFPGGAPARTPALDLLRGCDGTHTDGGTFQLREGDEPTVLYFADGDLAFLIESVHPVDAEGEVVGYPRTASGLLPAEVIDAVRAWWVSIARQTLITETAA